MAIIQISKIQQRSGKLVDLPQLDEAQFGFASDAKRLFIGAPDPENVEVLTAYSNISFSQLSGSDNSNLNISDPLNGQVLSYDSITNTWINAGGNALSPGNTSYYSNTNVHLGNVSNVKIGGGAVGFVLETDGTGNLSWTPKASIVANISNVTQANPGVVTTTSNHYFVDGLEVTITNVNGMTQLNGNSYYVNVLTSNTFSLYSDVGLTTTVNTTGFGAYTSNGQAVAIVSGSGTAAAGGANTNIQFNNSGLLDGSANFTINGSNVTLSGNFVVGNVFANTGNINSGNLLVSTFANIGNLNVSANVTSNLLPNANVTYNLGSSTQRWKDIYLSGTSIFLGNITLSEANSSLSTANIEATGNIRSGNANLGNLVTANFVAGTLTTAAQPNITSTGTLTSLGVTGNVTAGNVYANSGTIGASLLTGTLTTAAQPNVTSLGTLTSLGVTGNVTAGNFVGILANGNSSISIPTANGNINISAAGVTNEIVITSTGVNIAGTLNATGDANVGNIGAAAGVYTANVTAGNVYANSGTIGASLLTGTLTTAAQPNITSTGTLTSLTVSGNTTTGGVKTDNYYYANGVSISFAGSYSNSNVAAYLPTYTGNISAGNISVTGNTTSGNVYANSGTVGATSLTASGNATVGGIKTDNYYYANGVAISFAGAYSNSNVAAYLPTYTGNLQAGNVTTVSYLINSVQTGISAAGSTQGTATGMANTINIVSTISGGANGVRLPTAIAGMTIYITNTSSSNLNVYPATNGRINSLAANASFTQVGGNSTIHYIAASTTQWYTVGATYA